MNISTRQTTMKISHLINHSILGRLMLAGGLALAVAAPAQPVWVQPVESPVLHSNREATFFLKAPGARQVELSAQFLKGNRPLQADTNGLWSITVGAIAPNLYPYAFVVDGVTVADPNNGSVFPNERFKSSLVDIPGDTPASYSVQNVPHGEVTYAYYQSTAIGGTRPLVIYTPPGYRTSQQKYPVLYLISGTTDTEETWFKVGRVNFMLDNLIAQKQAVPMIVVMPYGNTMHGTPDPSSLQAAEMYQLFAADLVGGILPYVEANYRAIPARDQRAIAGFSRGGGQALFAGLAQLDQFAWIGSYSAYLTPEVFDKYFPGVSAEPAAANQQLKLLWLGVGKEDFLYQPAVTFMNLLQKKGIAHKTLITEGGHTWMNARRYLAETLPLYFK